jgi:hypothetical protein
MLSSYEKINRWHGARFRSEHRVVPGVRCRDCSCGQGSHSSALPIRNMLESGDGKVSQSERCKGIARQPSEWELLGTIIYISALIVNNCYVQRVSNPRVKAGSIAQSTQQAAPCFRLYEAAGLDTRAPLNLNWISIRLNYLTYCTRGGQ